ncbi:hypothetical protein QX249_08615 [Vibrio parahaemolyticus]|uniref:Uncharacterized protein n=1 Tax=Vibrio parahaemolyticus TaxID=670 RepID=A0AAW8PXJ5_VIBPH|nr:hypothetical protein [Vibrio parahaemolyticus]EGR2229322.1 hypothetical protein [Vibrio parahaemolyticus]MDS1820719.1 hypothetical protein [Vibrio parahaemolyticus]
MKKEATFKLFKSFRFTRFGLRGDLPLWLTFVDEIIEKGIYEEAEVKKHLQTFFEENTGHPLAPIEMAWSGIPLLPISKALDHERNHGMSAGMVSLKFWNNDAMKAIDSIFDQSEGK